MNERPPPLPPRCPRLASLILVAAFAGAPGPGGLLGQAEARQAAQAEGRRLLSEALGLAERGDTARALDHAERAARLAPDLADARFLYGLLLARSAGAGTGSWGRRVDASREFEAALRLDGHNPRYLLEVARLRLKQPLLRIQAERLFNRALEAARQSGDSAAVAVVEAEVGNIYFRRYQAMAHRRTVLGATQTFDWEAALRDPHYTKDLLLDYSTPIPGMGEVDLAKAEQHFRAGVAAAPASEAANAALLALLVATGRDEEVLDAARRFALAAPQSGTAQLYLGLGFWRVGRAAAADSAFGRALARLPESERAPLVDLAPILPAAEVLRYRELDDSLRAAFERLYWWQAEPMRLTAENEIRLEHLARVAYADVLFGAPDLRVRGWLTDRGQICIRYGPPPIIATFPPNPYDNGEDALATGAITTVWYYPKRNLRFVFVGPPAYNYQRLAFDFSAYAEHLRTVQPATYDNVPLARALDSIPIQAAQFRPVADSSGTDVVLFTGIPVRALVAGVDLHSGDVETGLFVTGADYQDQVIRRSTESVRFDAEEQFEDRTQTVRLMPGTHLIRAEARLRAAERAARGLSPLDVEDLRTGRLTLSDVIVADRVAVREEGIRPRGRQDVFIDPNAAMAFRRGAPLHLYAEVYDLAVVDTASVDPQVRYQVAVRLRVEALERETLAARVVGELLDAVGATAQGDDQVNLQYLVEEPMAGRDRVPVYVAVDLTGAPAGRYRLDLAITDLTTGAVAVRHRLLRVVATP